MARRTRAPGSSRSTAPGYNIESILEYGSVNGGAWPVGKLPALQDIIGELGVIAPLLQTYGTVENAELHRRLHPYVIAGRHIRHNRAHPAHMAIGLSALALFLFEEAGESDEQYMTWWMQLGGALRNYLATLPGGQSDGIYNAIRNLVDQATMSQMPGMQFPSGTHFPANQGVPRPPDGGVFGGGVRPAVNVGGGSAAGPRERTWTEAVADYGPEIGTALGVIAAQYSPIPGSTAALGWVGEQLGEEVRKRYGSGQRASQDQVNQVARELMERRLREEQQRQQQQSGQQDLFSPVPPTEQQSGPGPAGGRTDWLGATVQTVGGVAGMVGGAYGGQAGAQAGVQLVGGLGQLVDGIIKAV